MTLTKSIWKETWQCGTTSNVKQTGIYILRNLRRQDIVIMTSIFQVI